MLLTICFLSLYAAIINNKHFENGVVKLQSGLESSLSPAEKSALKMFLKPVPAGQGGGRAVPAPAPAPGSTSTSTSTTIVCLKITSHISGGKGVSGSCLKVWVYWALWSRQQYMWERLFSAAKLIFSSLRKRMDPDTLDMLLFLKANRFLWMDKCVIDDIIADWVWGGGWHPRAAQLDTVAAVANVLTSKLLVSYCNNCNNYYCYMPNGNNYLLGLASNKLLPINNLASLDNINIKHISY